MSHSTSTTLVRRPPVIVVMGHIDHGKSTLLDYIRKANVVAGEAGGITQHVGAYEAQYTGSDGVVHQLTFLDTPGHEAFGGIRARGAKAADIAILVVSAEDGVKPQTLDAYRAIQAQKIPYIVAITKTDKPNANIDRTKQSLGENEIYVEGWGGTIPCVAISAITGDGVPELLDMIMLVAELANLTADPKAPASGIVIETTLDTRKGISATVLIKNGTFAVGGFAVAGRAYTPIRYIENFLGTKIDHATASMPVQLLGWNEMPESGSECIIVASKKEAEKMAAEYATKHPVVARKAAAVKAKKDSPAASGSSGAVKNDEPEIAQLPLIIKTDVIGSLEGVKYELAKIHHDTVNLTVVSEGIGAINENDVKTAISDPNIVIIGFNVTPDKLAAAILDRAASPITCQTFTIIYDLVAYVKETLKSRIPKVFIEEMTGRAKILAVFSKEKDKQIVGGKVESGTIEVGADIRLMRREIEIGRGKIRDLQEKKVRAREVAEGHECGMQVECKIEIAPGDRIESVRTIEKQS